MKPSEFLRKSREDRGLTLEKISKEIGIPASTISTWERGGALPKGRNLRKICDFYGFSSDTFKAVADISNAHPVSVATFRKIPVVSWTTAGLARSYEDLANQIDELVAS